MAAVVTWAVAVAALVVAAAGCAGAPAGSTGTTPTPTVARTAPAPTAASAPPATADATPAGAPEVNPAGDIPDNQVFVPFTSPDNAVVVSVPEGWARAADGTATVFSDKFNSVRIEVAPRAAAADVASARATDVPQLQASVPGFALHDVRSVQRKGGTAVLITYDADSAVNPVTGKGVRDVRRALRVLAGRPAGRADPGGPDGCGQRRPVADRLRLAAVARMTGDAALPAYAVSARSVYRFYRAGDDETLALRGVSLDVGRGRARGPGRALRVGQVDPAGLPRGSRRSRTAAPSGSAGSG